MPILVCLIAFLFSVPIYATTPSRTCFGNVVVTVIRPQAAQDAATIDYVKILSEGNKSARDARLKELEVQILPFSIFEGALLQNKRRMVQRAIERIMDEPNISVGDRALMWSAYEDQIQKHITNDDFGSQFHVGADGSFVFQGYLGHMLVFPPNGGVFVGLIQIMQAGQVWDANYQRLNPFSFGN